MGIKQVFYGCANDRFGGCGSVLGVNKESVFTPHILEVVKPQSRNTTDNFKHRVKHPTHSPYEAFGGFLREEAIMILRRFYITENTNGLLTTDSHHSIYSPRPIKPRSPGRKLAACSKHTSIQNNKHLDIHEGQGLIKTLYP